LFGRRHARILCCDALCLQLSHTQHGKDFLRRFVDASFNMQRKISLCSVEARPPAHPVNRLEACGCAAERVLQSRVPEMKNKGRLEVGSDADITVFNPRTVIDNSTYEHPGAPVQEFRTCWLTEFSWSRKNALLKA